MSFFGRVKRYLIGCCLISIVWMIYEAFFSQAGIVSLSKDDLQTLIILVGFFSLVLAKWDPLRLKMIGRPQSTKLARQVPLGKSTSTVKEPGFFAKAIAREKAFRVSKIPQCISRGAGIRNMSVNRIKDEEWLVTFDYWYSDSVGWASDAKKN